MEEHVFLALGTNLGDRNRNLERCIEAIEREAGHVVATSKFYETKPEGFVSSHFFLNAAVEISTTLEPMALLDATRNIERTLGRTTKSKDGHYADRIIDIDILFYGDRIVNTATLTIPHRAIAQREFVLRPLMDIAPDFLHPTLHLSVRELMDNLQKNSAK